MVVPIVINSLLWYVYQRMKQLSQAMIIKVILDYYNSEEIEAAKELLFQHFPDQHRPKKLQRKITRQGLHKDENNVKDLLELFHEMSVADKFNPPIFATADSHFSSMDITNIDALALQNEVNLLRKEINTIKDRRNADNDTLIEIKKMLTKMKNANVKSFTISDTTDKGFFKEKKSLLKVLKENLVTNSTHSSSTNINSNIESSAFNGIEKWKITKKRRKLVTTVGKKMTTIFKSVKPLSRPSGIFVSRFQPHTTINSVENYVKTQFSDCKSVTCSLSTRYPSYTSFKIVMHGISL